MKCLVVLIAIFAIKCINVSGANEVHNKRLYVGGFSYSVDDDSLRELFEHFGDVTFVKVIRDFHSGRSKGFGFVEMNKLEEAKEAIEALHGSIHEGRTITVSEANPRQSEAKRGKRRSKH